MEKFKNIIYRNSGKTFHTREEAKLASKELKEHEIIRNNTVMCAEEIDLGSLPRSRQTIYADADHPAEGFYVRDNAAGDVADTATGYQIVIDTLTYIKKKVTQQKFYKVMPADYMPVVVGDGAFSASILTNRSFSNADDFESGNMRTGASDARLASIDIAVDGVNVPVINWAKGLGYSIFDVEQALRANNWDIIEQKHRARKENYDLGIQEIAFLGSKTDVRVPGLLTNPNIPYDSGVITKFISAMNATELAAFVQTLIATYFETTNATAMPNRFVIPYDDWTGLPQLTPGTVGTYPYPENEYLEKAFATAVRQYEPSFKIMPLAYADAARNPANFNYYMLYRYDDESLRLDLPVPYTTTQPNSLNNFQFSDTAYAQYTGLNVYRNLELQKLGFSA